MSNLTATKKNLRVFSGMWTPYIVPSNDSNGHLVLSGPVADFLGYFTRALKMNYTLIPTPPGNWGECSENGTCNGLFHMMNEQGGDFALGPIVASEQRLGTIKFTNVLFTTEMVLLVPIPPKSDGSVFAFLLALQPEAWLLTFITMQVLYLCLLFVHFTLKQERVKRPLSRYYWTLCEISFLKDYTWAPTNMPSRVIIAFWMFGTFVILSAYGGVLTSTYSITDVPDFVRNLADFARFPKMTPLVLKDSGESEFFQTNLDSPYKEVWHRIVTRDSQMSYAEMYEDITLLAKLMHTSKYALISLKAPILYLLTREEFIGQCNLIQFFISEPFTSSQVVLPVRRGIEPYLLEELNVRILHMQQTDLFENSHFQQGRDAHVCLQSKYGAHTNALRFRDVSGVFVLWMGGMGLAISALLLEKCFFVFRLRNRHNRVKKNNPEIFVLY